MNFSTNYKEILQHVVVVEPVAYGKSRNFIDGAVTRLSPYISRGVISTKQVFETTLKRGFHPNKIEKFIQELAWRDYWQQVWIDKKDLIDEDLRREQPNVHNYEMPLNIIEANTGIDAIDDGINEYYESGYLHNHLRMYIAMTACNVGGSHWRVPAKWMYYHLLDGDWASNALSWQWVSGANAGKEYYANQININKYCYKRQKGTFLDVDYEDFEGMEVPHELQQTITPELLTALPQSNRLVIDQTKPTFLYNYYNLDPAWHNEEQGNRILLLEPSVYHKYPIGQNAVDFMLELANNIEGIQIFTGEFADLVGEYDIQQIHYKEHPLNNYTGIEESRDWMFGVKGYYRSFFAFWKKCQKELKQWNQSTLFG